MSLFEERHVDMVMAGLPHLRYLNNIATTQAVTEQAIEAKPPQEKPSKH